MNRQEKFEFLKNQFLLRGLTNEQVQNLQDKFLEEKFNPNETIFEEGSKSSDLYIIVEGEVSVIKWDENHCSQALLGKINAGDVFGEISFLEPSVRSSSIKAIKPTTILKLSRESISENSMRDILDQIFINIGLVNTNRLRTLNALYVKTLQSHQNVFHLRQDSGKFLLFQYLILSLCAGISTLLIGNIRLYLPWLIAIIPAIILIKSKNYNWAHFGLNFRNALTVVGISLLIAILLIIVSFLLNGAFHLTPGPNIFFQPNLTNYLWLDLLFFALYSFSQECIARGILQTSIQDFFQDHKGYKSIFINGCFLFAFFFPLGFLPALWIFLINLPFGFFYLKQKSVVGVFLIHFILMAFGLINI